MQPGVYGSLVEHPQLLLCRVVPREAKQALEESGHRVEGGALMVGRALPALDAADLIAERLGKLVDQPALADAGLACYVRHGAAAAPGLCPGLRQPRQLRRATHDRRETAGRSDLEAPDRAGRPQDAVHAHRP